MRPTTKKPARAKKARAPKARAPRKSKTVLPFGKTPGTAKEAEGSVGSAYQKPGGGFAAGHPWRFPPGTSGNPSGARPDPEKHPRRFLSRRLIDSLKHPFPGDPQGRSYYEVGVDLMVAAAAAGDPKAMALAFERVEGVVPKSSFTDESNPLESPDWVRLRNTIVQALEQFPLAKAAVLAAIDADGQEDNEPQAG
jgi:hypothetical protein